MDDGFLLIDKPEGMTSHDVVACCRRVFKRRDIGHTGTLDPIATGLLVILIGKATKLSDFILNNDKVYKVTILLACETDTDDVSGQILRQSENFIPEPEQITKIISTLTGSLSLPVPIYSAVKVSGSKLYQKARRGEVFEPPIRQMFFSRIRFLSLKGRQMEVELTCSKGSYVRAWVKALGKELGCGATVENLRRMRAEPYSIENAVDLKILENLKPDSKPDSLSSAFIPLRETLPDFSTLRVDGLDEKLLLNGQLSRGVRRFLELEFGEKNKGIKVLSRHSGRLISVLIYQPPKGFKIKRVFPP